MKALKQTDCRAPEVDRGAGVFSCKVDAAAMRIDVLLEGISKENLHDLIDFGKPEGGEFWYGE